MDALPFQFGLRGAALERLDGQLLAAAIETRDRQLEDFLAGLQAQIGGPTAPTYVLRSTLLSMFPYSMWDINLLEAGDLGSLGNGGYMVVVPTTFVQGPDNVAHPLLGDVADRLWVTDSVEYGDAYTTGMTFVVMFKGTANTGTGSAMIKVKPSTELDRELGLIGNNNIYGVSDQATDLVARSIESTDDPLLVGQWNMLEVYFPPGDTTPVIYVNGTAPTATTSTPGTVGDNGDGYITVGGHYVSGGSVTEGYYALPAVFMRAISSGERANLLWAAGIEGWLP